MYTVIACCLLLLFLIAHPRLHAQMLPDGAYMSRERTCMVNGFFIWVVFVSHMNGYNVDVWLGDKAVLKCVRQLGQCCVATFFFYSGYGIMVSLKRKEYIKQLILNRLPTLTMYMTMAVCTFWLVQSLNGNELSIRQILLSCVGWSSIGNSNWFIFVTLIAYLIIAVSWGLVHRVGTFAVVVLTAVFFVCLIAILLCYKEYWWYDTCLCIPAGMLFSLTRERIEQAIKKSKLPAWIPGILVVPLSLIMYRYLGRWPYLNNISAILFAFGITLVFSCISLKHTPRFLCWCGGFGLFFLYIFQRIPMLIGARAGWNAKFPFMYQLFCVIVTVFIAWCASKIFPKISSTILKKR